ncbi:MAG TPA: hypothetical protein DD670_11405 [Planctomycetaceae bacterium]|nr:hypothetical protein [Planctomycetaceae bacterium]
MTTTLDSMRHAAACAQCSDSRGFLPSPMEMIAYLDRHVVGQPCAKRTLTTAVYGHYIGRQVADAHMPRHVVILGTTGSGKTYLVKTLAKFLNVPMTTVNATELSEVGYVGKNVETVILQLLAMNKWDIEATERSWVLVDEIDKKRRRDTGFRDISGEGVQMGLLPLFGGEQITVNQDQRSAVVDCSKILFICAGAFVGLKRIIRHRLDESDGIGFQHACLQSFVHDNELLHHVEIGDLQEYGVIPELLGRLTSIAVLDELTREQLIAIMNEAEDSVVRRLIRFFALHGVELLFEHEALEAIADHALLLGTGARGLSREVLRALETVEYRLPELVADGVTRIRITADVVERKSQPVLERCATEVPNILEDIRRNALWRLAGQHSSSSSTARQDELPTNTEGWSEERLAAYRDQALDRLNWGAESGSTRTWFESFLKDNSKDIPKLRIVCRLLDEILVRQASINEFFLAYLYGATENIQAVLAYMDYRALKRQEEEQRRKRDPDGAS